MHDGGPPVASGEYPRRAWETPQRQVARRRGAVPASPLIALPGDRATRNVVILAFDEVTGSDICGPADIFQLANGYSGRLGSPAYRVTVASTRGGIVRTSSGVLVATTPLADLDLDRIDTLIVPGGGPPQDPPVPRDLLRWLAETPQEAARICSICTGAFLLAEAALLDGVTIATHWEAAPALARRFPSVRVEHEPVFVRDGRIWSSGGFTAALDLTLALVEEDHGYDVAMKVTRSLALFLRRPGDQPQVSSALSTQAAGDPAFARLHAWIMQNLAADLRTDILADRVGMSQRTFARRYVEQVGTTPAKTVETFRLEAARRAILQSDDSLKRIAAACGFGDEQNLRRAFVRRYGLHPEGYRRGTDPVADPVILSPARSAASLGMPAETA